MVSATGYIDADFEHMQLPELIGWYIENVGYDPVKDDPSTELQELRDRCRELVELERSERNLST